jgi:hypothetical protein
MGALSSQPKNLYAPRRAGHYIFSVQGTRFLAIRKWPRGNVKRGVFDTLDAAYGFLSTQQA